MLEGIQTGDGRVIASGAVNHADLPLPFAWARDGTQHVDIMEVAPQVGTIETLSRSADGTWAATGTLDDEQPDGAELARRMDAGTASHGNREFVSVDPDDIAIQVIAMEEGDDEDTIIVASGSIAGRMPTWALFDTRAFLASLGLQRRAVTAAAGEPDPGPDGGPDGVVLFEDSIDSMLLRFTRMRLRGVTAVPTPAFDGAFIELDAVGASTDEPSDDDEPSDEEPPPENDDGDESRSIVAHGAPALVHGLLVPDAPAREVFDEPGEPDGSLNVDDYRVSGYVALWDTCHTAYSDQCIRPPREDASYGMFRHGSVVCEDGSTFSTGPFTWGIPHADLDLELLQAQAQYADARHGFADVVVGANEYGIWHAGALRPAMQGCEPLTRDDVRVLRALSMSGDWRYDWQTRTLRMIAALAVNHPGFPVPRIVASAAARRASHVVADPGFHHDGTRITAMVAAGMVHPVDPPGMALARLESSDCGCGTGASLARIERKLSVLDARTQHLRAPALSHVLERLSRES